MMSWTDNNAIVEKESDVMDLKKALMDPNAKTADLWMNTRDAQLKSLRQEG